MKLELIEFVTATAKRAVGEQMMVDPGSAVSFCDKQKVAVRVGAERPAAAVVVDDELDDDVDDDDLDD